MFNHFPSDFTTAQVFFFFFLGIRHLSYVKMDDMTALQV